MNLSRLLCSNKHQLEPHTLRGPSEAASAWALNLQGTDVAKAAGCVLIGLSNTVRVPPVSMVMTLVSSAAIVGAEWRGCTSLNSSTGARWACRFAYVAPDSATYNISVRASSAHGLQRCTKRTAFRATCGSWGSFTHGGYTELALDQLYQLIVRAAAAPSAALPRCTFAHEEALQSAPLQNALRWAASGDKTIRRVWHNDTLQWQSQLCSIAGMSIKNFDNCMMRQHVQHIVFMGDSLMRHMFGDFEDQYNGVTAEWLEQHPVQYAAEHRRKSAGEEICSRAGLDGAGCHLRVAER